MGDLHGARRSDCWTSLNASGFLELLAVSWPGAAGSEPAKRLLAQPEHGLIASAFGSSRRSPFRLLDFSECICFPGALSCLLAGCRWRRASKTSSGAARAWTHSMHLRISTALAVPIAGLLRMHLFSWSSQLSPCRVPLEASQQNVFWRSQIMVS